MKSMEDGWSVDSGPNGSKRWPKDLHHMPQSSTASTISEISSTTPHSVSDPTWVPAKVSQRQHKSYTTRSCSWAVITLTVVQQKRTVSRSPSLPFLPSLAVTATVPFFKAHSMSRHEVETLTAGFRRPSPTRTKWFAGAGSRTLQLTSSARNILRPNYRTQTRSYIANLANFAVPRTGRACCEHR